VGEVSLDRIQVTPLQRIRVIGGDVLHALKRADAGFVDFGEAYFSFVEPGAVKAWKLHRQMTLNLVVPIGEVRFVFLTEPSASIREEIIGTTNYARLTVPPGIWFGFQGIGSQSNLILNIADIPHKPDEVERRSQEHFDFSWDIGK
jgi:dTDP-4-dehydrorhamnose 3,5-epimerase